MIFGTKTTQITIENINEKCNYCGIEKSLKLYVYQKYAHVFWIPVFPLNKIIATQCSHCKQVIERNNLLGISSPNNEDLAKKVKTPLWTFLGLLLFVVIVIGVVLVPNIIIF